MKEIKISESDISAVTTKLKQISHNVSTSSDPEWSRSPAVKVIDCVLSLNRTYDTFVVRRLDTFVERHPMIQRITDLAELIANYSTPHAFVRQELNYDDEARANILASVVKYVCTIVKGAQTVEEEKETLKQWAIQAEPQEHLTLNIRGFAIAGFQYLRMLFGADTTKPDIYIKRFISETLNRNVSDIESLLLLEAASERAGLSVRSVDSFIWKSGARGQQDTLKTNTVHLDPDVAAAFPTEEAVNEALRSVLKEWDEKE